MEGRNYIAISIKHSQYIKDGLLCLWGNRRTEDDDKRCFGGYTDDIEKCELYSAEEFKEEYHWSCVMLFEPVKMCFDLVKKYKKFDTVLVDVDEYRAYLKLL